MESIVFLKASSRPLETLCILGFLIAFKENVIFLNSLFKSSSSFSGIISPFVITFTVSPSFEAYSAISKTSSRIKGSPPEIINS